MVFKRLATGGRVTCSSSSKARIFSHLVIKTLRSEAVGGVQSAGSDMLGDQELVHNMKKKQEMRMTTEPWKGQDSIPRLMIVT